jgi:hypothetical protein
VRAAAFSPHPPPFFPAQEKRGRHIFPAQQKRGGHWRARVARAKKHTSPPTILYEILYEILFRTMQPRSPRARAECPFQVSWTCMYVGILLERQ